MAFAPKKKKKLSDVTQDKESEEQKDLSSKEEPEDDDHEDLEDDEEKNHEEPDGDEDDDSEADEYEKGKLKDGSNKSVLTLDKDGKSTNSPQIKINPPLRDVYEQILDMPEHMREHAIDRLIDEYGAEAVYEAAEEDIATALFDICENEGIELESLLESVGAGEEGTDELVYNYLAMTPGQPKKLLKIDGSRYNYPENMSLAKFARDIQYIRSIVNQKTRSTTDKIGLF
jgi:hypothetical protein